MKLKVILFSLCAAMGYTASAQENIIKNGDFDRDSLNTAPSEWEVTVNDFEPKIIQVENGGIGESHLLKMGIAATQTQCDISQKIAVMKDSTYEFSGYFCYSGKVTQSSLVNIENTRNEVLETYSIPTTSVHNNYIPEESRFRHAFAFTANTDTIVLRISINGINRLLRIDKLSLTLKQPEKKPEVHETQAFYYVDPEQGENTNSGLTAQAPLKDLSGVYLDDIKPGCQILFKAGTIYKGMLSFTNVHGTAEAPITIATYGNDEDTDSLATLDGAGRLSAIALNNCSYFDIKDLDITADGGGFEEAEGSDKMRCGVVVRNTEDMATSRHIHLSGLRIHDIFYYNPGYKRPNDQSSANGTGGYGYGIRFLNTTNNAVMDHITVSNVQIQRVSHTGIRLTGAVNNGSMISNVAIDSVNVRHSGGPGMQMGSVKRCLVHHCSVDKSGSGSDKRNWQRGSGLWTWGCDSVIVEHNRFTNASGPADSFGSHIDYNCKNIIFQYNFYANNVGGFVEILGNSWNCAYRYNLSINDGTRNVGQPGRSIWLSGYCGRGAKRQGPNNIYIYNNTILTKDSVVSRYSIEKTTKGILLANNIIHVQGTMKSASKQGHAKPYGKDVFFENNVLLKDEFPIVELGGGKATLIGDAQFVNPDGNTMADFAPTNKELVYNRGVEIKNLPGDSIGLMTGLEMKEDILGTALNGRIDMGAVAYTDVPSSVDAASLPTIQITSEDGQVHISTEEEGPIKVYNMHGQLIHQANNVTSTTFHAVPDCYLIQVGKQVFKIIIY